jgi:hypothetical protein
MDNDLGARSHLLKLTRWERLGSTTRPNGQKGCGHGQICEVFHYALDLTFDMLVYKKDIGGFK